VSVVLGDARLTLGRTRAGQYDIVIADAFSSDAVPVHLLTREAIAGYVRALAPQGIIAVHITNRHMKLEPVIAAVALENGLAARIRRDDRIPPSEVAATTRPPSVWVILARSETDFGEIAADKRWLPLRTRSDVPAWTDDFSNIVRVIKWH